MNSKGTAGSYIVWLQGESGVHPAERLESTS